MATANIHRRALTCAVWTAVASLTGAGIGARADLAPFEVVYDVRLVGIGAGESTVQLEIDDDHLLYTSTTVPRGILAVLFGSVQASARMRRENGVLIPEEYLTRHARNPNRDQRYVFDAHGRSVDVLKEGRTYLLPVERGTLDEASVQLQLMRDARGNDGPWSYPVVSNGKLKRYRFTATGVETITTALGEIETLRVERVRVRDDREDTTDHHYWLSPGHHYLPVRVERLKKGKVRRVITVKTIR